MFSRIVVSTALIALAVAPLAAHAAEERPLTEWSFRRLGKTGDAFAPVTLPHTWNKDDSRLKNYYRGPAVYVKDLGAGSAFGGKRVFFRCEALNSVATVVLNGRTLGEHKGGYTAFGFELTPALSAGGPNKLEVFGDNAKRADVNPQNMDFSQAGGMHRGASLVLADKVCISPILDGTRGVTVAYGKASREHASATVTIAIDNGGAENVAAKVRFTLLDAEGKKVAEVVRDHVAAPGVSRVAAELALDRPHLWNGVKDPYRYAIKTTLVTDDGESDERTLAVGFRDIRFDAEKGCFLNGVAIRLDGVNRHQENEAHGIALTPEENRADIRLIRELGANAVRLAHYPHAQETLDECDRLGLLVWSEIPMTESVGFPVADPGIEANAISQLREEIRQRGFHPSIFCWSLFNELGMSRSADYTGIVKAVNDVAHAEDPSRPTVGATFHYDKPESKALASIPDLMAFNNYPGWYYRTPDRMGDFVDAYRKLVPGKGWAVSEYGAGGNPAQHELNITKNAHFPSGKFWHPEEWQCRVHEGNYATLKDAPLWGTFLWSMFDFATVYKNEGGKIGINDKGLVTRDRAIRKDAFYFYQANWSEKPVLHLNSRRAKQVGEPVVPIRLYSNLKDITVTFNGEKLAAPKLYAPMAYEIAGVRLKPGVNKVEASAKTASGETVTDSLEWELVDKIPGKPDFGGKKSVAK